MIAVLLALVLAAEGPDRQPGAQTGDSAAGTSAPGTAKPDKSKPDKSTSGNSASGNTTPGNSAPGTSTSGSSAGGSSAAGTPSSSSAPGAAEPADAASKPSEAPPESPPTLGPGASSPQTLAPPAAVPKRHRWFVLPVPFYTPETRFGLAVTSGYHFELGGAPRASSAFASAAYSFGGQGALDLATEAVFRNGSVLAARGRLVNFPDVYYGIGSETPSSASEDFTRRGAELVAAYEIPIPGVRGLRAGPRVDLRTEAIRGREPGGALASGTVTGWDGYSAASLGGNVTWDTRQGTFWPSRGSMVQAWYVFAPAGGHHDSFGRGVLEGRHFVPLGRGSVLGFDAYAEGAHGDPPFTLLPKLGSSRFMRGIREGRYRDRLDWAVQSELRIPVHGRISGVAFVAAGDVAHSFQDLTLSTVKVAGGVGGRFRLTDEGANIRIDVAASGLGVEFYALVLEAF